jgi:FAD/FMN-containing dehydrogenase
MSTISRLQSVFADIVAPSRILSDPQSLKFYGKDWLKDFTPDPALVLLPESAHEVQAIVRCCAAERIAIVPSGGRTGLSGGAAATLGEVVVNLERIRTLYEVNKVDRTVLCDAGVTLEALQNTAQAHGLYFPVDFSSRGSAQIGGAIATNAGGIRVIKYGNMRESVLGLTVVTGTGDILELNGALFKNNSGYDLRNLFIGSEGTLGIIVGATLKLRSQPKSLVRALCGLGSVDDTLPLLTWCRDTHLELSAFELMERLPFEEVVQHRGLRDPLSQPHKAYALVEYELNAPHDLQEVQALFVRAYEQGIVQDVVVSESSAQAAELMNLRDLVSETLSQRYTLHKNDISVPVPAIPAFIRALHDAIRATYPLFRVAIFGHVGDGNLHVNVLKPEAMSDSFFYTNCHAADDVIFSLVRDHRGSVSAEHGVGLLKRDFLHYTRSAAEISLMRGLKSVFDPNGIMNPGKIFASDEGT